MTITNEPTTTTEVPAWLNLDAVVPQEAREAIDRTLHTVKRNLDEIRNCASGIRLWVREGDQLVADLPDDVGQAVLTAAGIAELHQLGFDIAHIFETAVDGKPCDEAPLERLDQVDSDDYAEEVQP